MALYAIASNPMLDIKGWDNSSLQSSHVDFSEIKNVKELKENWQSTSKLHLNWDGQSVWIEREREGACVNHMSYSISFLLLVNTHCSIQFMVYLNQVILKYN